MNLTKLFKTQAELDKKIIEEKGLQGQDLLDKKILALQVELGELANEWRGFKYWSEDQSPKPPKYNWGVSEDGLNQEWIPEYGYESYPLLEEYVDCLHFILSIGNEIGYQYDEELHNSTGFRNVNITHQFLDLFHVIAVFLEYESDNLFEDTLLYFLSLGEMLSFTWEQVEQAYYQKNEINHERQANGY